MQKNLLFVSIVRLLTLLLLAVMTLILAIPASLSADDEDDLASLWIDLSLGPPLIDLFNDRAHAEDLARVEHISQLDILKDVNTGKKLVVFKSAEDAIRLLPHIHEEIDIIGYNLEHGPANPQKEQENPVEYIRLLRDAVDQYDLEIALGPDHNFAVSHAIVMAPYADYLILQIQKVQTEPETVYDFVRPILQGVRVANPDIQTSVQIRTEGDVNDLLEMLQPLQDEIDGISILTSEETLEITEEIMDELRAVPVEPTPAPEDIVIEEEVDDGEEVIASDSPITATIVATTRQENHAGQTTRDDTNDIIAEINEEIAEDGIVESESAAEANQRNGTTWLFVGIALVVGFALGAGYISYRSSS